MRAELPKGQIAAQDGDALLGEGFCTMVVSGLDANRQIVYGGEISRDSVFKLAVVAFSDAIAGGNADIVNMARVGRARAYLDLGQPALARADAQLVPALHQQPGEV